MELKNYRKRIEYLLSIHEKARDNDGVLIAHYLNTFCPSLVDLNSKGEKTVMLKNFKKMPSFENIRRARQIVQNTKGLYLPLTEKVLKARRIKEKNFKDCEVREAKYD